MFSIKPLDINKLHDNKTDTQIWVLFKPSSSLSNDLLEPLSNVSHSDNSANVDTIWIQEWSSMLFHWRDPVLEGKFFSLDRQVQIC